jgi:predicted metalloprotease with PDZ domain
MRHDEGLVRHGEPEASLWQEETVISHRLIAARRLPLLRRLCRLGALLVGAMLASFATAHPASAQARPASSAPARSAPLTDVRYTLTFLAAEGVDRAVDVTMTFGVAGKDAVLLSLPVWTPGSYEVSNYARFVSKFAATSRGKSLRWDKADPDTWRVYPDGAGEVSVTFRAKGDSLDNAFTWARDEFALVNGTSVFLYPEGRPLDYAATVDVVTEPSWRVISGMPQRERRIFAAATYHELVDHPFFIGRFDVDSAQVAGAWMRFSSYPSGSVSAARRARLLEQMAKAIPQEVAVFGERPWNRYDILQIADSASGGMGALEHENSNVAVIGYQAFDEEFVPSVYAHEIMHAFNVKRLRPLDMWPYRYDAAQPTPWLWVSEGITDYYADLALVRGKVVGDEDFLGTTQKKMEHVDQTVPVALEDASLQAWLHVTDGTDDIYYDKGSLAGLALDILIRDASDNASSLDDVMRELYTADYKNGRGFTADEWWGAVSRHAKGMKFADFAAKYVDGRESYPWATWLAKAGWRMREDTTREARLGVSFIPDSAGLKVNALDPVGTAATSGVHLGDVITMIGGLSTLDQSWQSWQSWRQKYGNKEGTPLSLTVLRNGRPLTINASVKLSTLIDKKLENDPKASEKTKRIRQSILTGKR